MSSEDADVLDSLLDKLRNGATIGRKARRAKVDKLSPTPLGLEGASGDDAADIARDMLARLKSSGFETIASPTTPSAPRRARSRPRRMSNANYPPSPNPVLTEVEDEASAEEDE
jgi:cytokinesis protein